MSLTAGSTLQNGKYLIETALQQSEAGISYRAMHLILNQPVVIQTLNPSLQQSPRFEMLRQQFLAAVRQGSHLVIVRDCFEEAGLPYVVLEPIANQPPTPLSEWMPFLKAALLGSAPDAITGTNGNSTNGNGAVSPPSTQAAGADPVPLPQIHLPVLPAAIATAEPELPTPTAPVKEPAALPPVVAAPVVSTPRRRWLPIALLLTAIASGLGGAAFAWSLRQGASSPTAPALFSREQSFPPKTDWLGEDPYADTYTGENYPTDTATPAIERRSITPRRSESVPDYVPRPRRAERPEPSHTLPQPDPEDQPAAEAPPKIEVAPDPVPSVQPPAIEPPAAAPAPIPAPAVPAEPNPKTRIPAAASEPPVVVPPPAEPISQ